MGYFRAHHKKKGKCERSQIAHVKPFIQVHGKPEEEFNYSQLDAYLRYHAEMDKVTCCPTDSCNNGEGKCDGSCHQCGKH